jgi:iron complex outermembrane recepter protein
MGSKMSVKHHIVVSYAVLAALTVPALADTASPDSTLIETVVVTAQKREQNPVEVPFALTAYSGDFMKNVGIQEFDKLSLFVPGFVVQNQSPNNPGFGLRGLTLDSGDPTEEPRVSVFEDGVSISTTRGTYIELFDIERIEVAKGPQTTLFGRAALMGGVNVIQNKANPDAFSAAANAEIGDYNYRMVDGAVNIPLADDLAVRIAGRYKSRDGYVKNLNGGENYNSVNTGAARLSLSWTPTDAFSADLIFNFEEDSPSGTSFKSGTFSPSDPATGTVLGTTDHNTGATLSTVSSFEGGKRLGLDRTVWDGKVLLGYKFGGGLSLSTITAYRRFDSEEVFDPDGFSKPLIQAAEDERGDQFSHEMRVNYDNGGRVSAFGGVDYFYSNTSQRVPMQINEYGILSLYTWGNSPAYRSTMNNLLQNTSDGTFNAAMNSFTNSYLTSTLYGSYYSAYYNALVGAYGSSVAAYYANSYATSLSGSYGPALANEFKTDHWEQATYYGKTKSVDLYGDVTVHATEQLEFEAGLRFTHDDKTSAVASKIGDRSVLGILMKGSLASVLGSSTELAKLLTSTAVDAANLDSLLDYGLLAQPTAGNGSKVSKSFDDSGLTWRVAARYALAENTSLYATYARGRRPKLLNAETPDTPYGDPTFSSAAAEKVDSYEVGAKTVTLDGKLHADVAFYFYEYSNFQTRKMQNLAYVTTNAGKAEAYGIEAALDWAALPWMDVFATYDYNRARFIGDTIYKGDQFRLNPDHKMSLGASLRQKALGGTFNFLPTYTWQSKIYFDDANDRADLQTTAMGNLIADTTVDEVQKQYGLLNLRLTWQPDDKPWSVGIFASNVLDAKYIKDAGNSGDNLGIPTFISGEPRFVGGQVSYKFQ